MIQDIITTNNVALEATNIFEKLFELCVQVRDAKDKVRPAQYCSGGELEPVNRFDEFDGMGYWRKTGPITQSPIEDDDSVNMVSCANYIERTIPLRFVAIVPKKKMLVDDAYAEERLGLEITRVLSGVSLTAALGARSAEVDVTSIDTDNDSVTSSEYTGIENIKDIRYKFAYLALDITVTLQIRIDCIEDICANY